MISVRRKLAIQFAASNGATAVNFVLVIILSRMLKPSEIGIFSLAAVVVGFAHVFRDFGVTSYIRRQKTLTPHDVRAAMGVLICASWTIAALLFLASWPIAEFFKQEGVRHTVQVLAAGFLFIPFGSIPQAILSRDLQAEKQAIVTGVTTATYFCASVVLASNGFGYMTMAWANLINIIVSGIAYTAVRPKGLPWLPSFRGWGKVVNFGAGAMLASIFKAIDDAVGDLILGRLSGPRLVGLFSRANSTVNIFFQVIKPTINYAALPYLAKTHHDGQDMLDVLNRSTAYLTVLLWPVLLATSVLGSDIVRVLYGELWIDAADAIPWLCLAFGTRVTFHLLDPAVTSIGRPYLTAIPLGCGVVLKLIIAVSMFDGSLHSFARAFAIAEVTTSPIYLLIAGNVLNMKLVNWWQALWRSAVSTGIVGLILAGLLFFENPALPAVLRLLIAAAVLFPAWFAALYLTQHPIRAEFSRFTGSLGRPRR